MKRIPIKLYYKENGTLYNLGNKNKAPFLTKLSNLIFRIYLYIPYESSEYSVQANFKKPDKTTISYAMTPSGKYDEINEIKFYEYYTDIKDSVLNISSQNRSNILDVSFRISDGNADDPLILNTSTYSLQCTYSITGDQPTIEETELQYLQRTYDTALLTKPNKDETILTIDELPLIVEDENDTDYNIGQKYLVSNKLGLKEGNKLFKQGEIIEATKDGFEVISKVNKSLIKINSNKVYNSLFDIPKDSEIGSIFITDSISDKFDLVELTKIEGENRTFNLYDEITSNSLYYIPNSKSGEIDVLYRWDDIKNELRPLEVKKQNVITDISIIYESKEDLESRMQTADNGTVVPAKTNGSLPIKLYEFSSNENKWLELVSLNNQELYINLREDSTKNISANSILRFRPNTLEFVVVYKGNLEDNITKYINDKITDVTSYIDGEISKAKKYTDQEIHKLIDLAPEELNTLRELANAYTSIGIKGVNGTLNEQEILNAWETLEDGRYTLTSEEYGKEIVMVNKTNNEFSRILPSGKVIAYDFEENEWIQVSGGGGGGDSSIISITPITPLEVVSSIKTKTIIEFSWTSGSYGNGMLYTYVDNSLRGTPRAISQGTVSADISDYMTESTDYAVKFVIEDAYGNKRTIIYKVSIVELSVKSIFNDEDFYKSTIRYEYQVYGNADKTMHFILDGVEKTEEVTSNGNNENYFITGLTHGVHTFQVYATAKINGTDIKSNVYDYNIIYYEENNPRPLLSSKFKNVTITEGDNVVINYIAYTATSLQTSVVKHIINGNEKVYYNIPRGVQTWRVTDYNVGENTIKIQATNIIDESTSYTTELVFNVFVNKGEMKVEAEKNNLDLFLNSSVGKSNNDVDRNKWEYGNITTTFNDFNWNTNGWILDNNNITALKLNGDARAIINYAPFANDIKTNGISIEIEFSTSNVLNYDEEIINIMANNIGISVKPTEFIFKSLQKEIITQFKEDEHIRIGLVIQKAVENRFIFTYINGVLSNVFTYGSGDSFDQLTPASITIGSNYCDINIYKIRVYTTALSPITMLNNYIADVEILSEKQKIYNRNKIYDANNNVLYNLVKGIMPVLTITCDNLPDAEGVVNTCSIQFENLFNSALNFDLSNVEIKVQGTSSLQYPYKNFDLTLQESLIQLYANAIKEKKVTLKVDYASSAGVYNAGNAKIVNNLYQVKNPAQQEDARVRNAIYGIPVAVFLKKSATDTPKFHCKGSLNTSKLANALGYKEGDESWSTENSTSPLCLFDTNDFSTIGTDFDPRYLVEPTEPAEDYDKYANLKDLISWVYSCKGNVEKFKAEVEQHFNLYYLKMYYIYFMVMGGIDSMAKNMYLTYFAKEGKWYPQFYDMDSAFGIDNTGRLSFNYNIEPLDKVGNDYAFNGSLSVLWNLVKEAYDINKLLLQENEGNTTVVEDTDTISYMYRDLRSKGILTYESMMRVLYNDGIEMYPESIYNEDTEVKYIDWYLLKGKDYLSSALGSTLDHLKFWIANRINYLDSKWLGEDYLTDRISCRITTPEFATPDYSLSLKSYRDMYMEIQYGSYYASTRADRNKTYVLEPELPSGTKFNDTETYIYGASSITEIGDLSKWYLSLFEGANAIKLSRLILGNPSSSYSNSNLKTLTLCTTESAPNYMMRYIDIRNCTGLEGSLDLSKLFALETIYAEGTNLKAIEFSNGGNLKLAHLPSTVNTLTLLNQSSLTDFQFEATNIVNLRIENSNVDTLDIIEKSIDKLNRVRLVGIDWQLNDAEILRVLLTKKGYTDSGANNEKSVLAGKVHINATIYSDEIEDFQRQWGTSLVITANNKITRYACRFYNDNVLLYTQRVLPNQDVTYRGVLPTKEYTGDGYYAYKFIGWDKPLTNITKSTNFYAQFELAPYHQVVFQDYLGNVISTKYVPDGTLATYDGEIPTKPTDTDKKEKYVFSGWNPSIDLPITQNTIFTPQFTIIPLWTVTWQNWDNTLLYTELVENGKYATYVGETPTRPNDAQYGYTFSGWQPNNENTPITSDTTFTAGYSVEVLIKIQYLNWDGTVLQEFGVKKDESYSYTGATPTRPDNESFKDYVFIRFEATSYSETSRTYTAYFEGTLRTYNVYWYSEGNLIELDSNVPYGATAEYNGVTPTHSKGYSFSGWGTDDFTVTGDMYFYAEFAEPSTIEFTVRTANITPSITVRGISDTYPLTIDWGDGTTDTYNLTKDTITTCTKSTGYANTGDYIVKIPPSNDFEFYGVKEADRLLYDGGNNLTNSIINNVTLINTEIKNAQYLLWNKDSTISLADRKKEIVIKLNGNYEEIPMRFMYGCNRTFSITLPKTIKIFGATSFYNTVQGPRKVYYKGTIEDWCNINCDVNFYGPHSPFQYINNGTNHFYLWLNNEWTEITEIVIPDTVTNINSCQFAGFSKVTSVIIPNSVTTINGNAFGNCSSLITVKLLSTTPPSIQSNSFTGNVVEYRVPASAVEAYKTATNWSSNASKIVADE